MIELKKNINKNLGIVFQNIISHHRIKLDKTCSLLCQTNTRSKK